MCIRDRDGTVGNTGFADIIPIKKGAKLMIISNLDTPDGLVNGTQCTLVDVVRTKKGEVDKLILKSKDPAVGERNRAKFPQLAERYPDCFFLERITHTYTISRRSGDIGSTASLFQFPVRLAFAITTHKIQGQSILAPAKVVLDIDSSFQPAMVYVMLSRVQRLDQIYILGKFNPKKISCIKASLEETERLERISINRNPTPWNAAITGSINVASLNCMGLRAHHQDILADVKLMKADVLQLSETSLTTESNLEAVGLPGFKSYHTVVANGKGISSYCKEVVSAGSHMDMVRGTDFQVSILSLPRVDCINVYRSSSASLVETANAILDGIKDDKPTLIMGDFNVCTVKQPNNLSLIHISEPTRPY